MLCFFLFLSLTISSNVYELSAISSLHDETYDNLLDLLKVNFNVPLKQKKKKKKKKKAEVRSSTILAKSRPYFSERGQGMLRWGARIDRVSCIGHSRESIKGGVYEAVSLSKKTLRVQW